MLFNYPWSLGLPWSVIDIPSGTPFLLQKLVFQLLPSQSWSFVGLSCACLCLLFFFGAICHRCLLEFFCLLFDSGLSALRGCGSLLITIYYEKRHLWWGVSSGLGLGLVSISYLLMCTSVTPKCGCSAHSFASMSQFPRLCNLQPACLKGVYSNYHIIWSLI